MQMVRIESYICHPYAHTSQYLLIDLDRAEMGKSAADVDTRSKLEDM